MHLLITVAAPLQKYVLSKNTSSNGSHFAPAGARLSKWLGRDVVESQLLGRGVRRGNSTQNHALSGCTRLIRLVLRCLLSPTTRDNFAASEGPIWRCEAAEDGVSRGSLQRSAKTCFF